MNFKFLVILFGFFFAVQASPLLLAPRADLVVFVPRIISPTSDSNWSRGKNETVLWSTDNAPKDISNAASIYLKNLDDCTGSDPILLAQNFSLRAGNQVVTIPSDIPPGMHYQIILFGDSGDHSQNFTIS